MDEYYYVSSKGLSRLKDLPDRTKAYMDAIRRVEKARESYIREASSGRSPTAKGQDLMAAVQALYKAIGEYQTVVAAALRCRDSNIKLLTDNFGWDKKSYFVESLKYHASNPAEFKRAYEPYAKKIRKGMVKIKRDAEALAYAMNKVYIEKDPEWVKSFGEAVTKTWPMKAFYAGQKIVYRLVDMSVQHVGPFVPPSFAFTGEALLDVLDVTGSSISMCISVGICLVRWSDTQVEPYYTFGFHAGAGKNSSLGCSLAYCGAKQKRAVEGFQGLQVTVSEGYKMGGYSATWTMEQLKEMAAEMNKMYKASNVQGESYYARVLKALEHEMKAAKKAVPTGTGVFVQQPGPGGKSYTALLQRYYNKSAGTRPCKLNRAVALGRDALNTCSRSWNKVVKWITS
jgi:hypothetical protein